MELLPRDYASATRNLVAALGIDPASYERFVAWCLAEQLVSQLARVVTANPAHREQALWSRPDGLRRFRDLLQAHTGRSWEPGDYETLFGRVRLATERHERKPIASADLLRLLWNVPHECAQCRRSPPQVVLHVDHRFPASRGGSSRFENLQFLCAQHNLSKSDRLQEEELWLNSV